MLCSTKFKRSRNWMLVVWMKGMHCSTHGARLVTLTLIDHTEHPGGKEQDWIGESEILAVDYILCRTFPFHRGNKECRVLIASSGRLKH